MAEKRHFRLNRHVWRAIAKSVGRFSKKKAREKFCISPHSKYTKFQVSAMRNRFGKTRYFLVDFSDFFRFLASNKAYT